MHTTITSDLFSLDQERTFEISFPDVDRTLLAKMRLELSSATSFVQVMNLKAPTLTYLLKKAGDEKLDD
ncbi:hypothetical protein [Sporosarcina sp. SAFN-010]|uniref:hypothetical protein n=1 Tax=Sporosarcina sp. SAFN-010 TaxID=3387273 RepID=UPI003F802204